MNNFNPLHTVTFGMFRQSVSEASEPRLWRESTSRILTASVILSIIVLLSVFLYSDVNEINSLLNSASRAFDEKKTEYGLALLNKVAKMAEEQKDSQACFKIGLEYKELGGKLSAISILRKGAGFAIDQERWTLVGEYAMALQGIEGGRDIALDLYDRLFMRAGMLRDKDTISVLQKKYKELGYYKRAELCTKMIDILSMPPPANWPLSGETVRDAKSVSDVSQQCTRSLADQEIKATMEYFLEMKRLKEQRKKRPLPGGGDPVGGGPYQY